MIEVRDKTEAELSGYCTGSMILSVFVSTVHFEETQK